MTKKGVSVRIRFFLSALILLLGVSAEAMAASNPIPGIGIVVKRPCPKCVSSSRSVLAVPGGFFGSGTAPFNGVVDLEGRCSFECGGCDSDCGGGPPDGRIDYATDAPSGPLDASLTAMTLYSTAPIPVEVGGVASFFDVFVEISGPGPLADDLIPGTVALPSGASLDLGPASTVESSALDLHATVTFADHTTGIRISGSLEWNLHLTLQTPDLPIARIADGTPAGHIVMGGNGVTVQPFTYASAGDELRLSLLSLEPGAPVPARASTWGLLKALYR